jgi:hypothetical protein
MQTILRLIEHARLILSFALGILAGVLLIWVFAPR